MDPRAGPLGGARGRFALLVRGASGKHDRHDGGGVGLPEAPKPPPGRGPATPSQQDTPPDEANVGGRSAHKPNPRPGDDEDAARGAGELDCLDPAARRAAQLGPPITSSAVEPAALAPRGDQEVAPRARVSMEELLPQLVRRIAWAGDRRRGSVQLELGAGRHEGTIVTVHSDGGRVRVQLDGHDVDDLRSRIRSRLERGGLDVESVT